MKRIVLFSIILISLLLTSFGQTGATCKDLAQAGLEIINSHNYIPDGRFNSTVLKLNDVSQVYKPFIKGKKYMIVIKGDEALPGFDVTLSDMTRKVIYHQNTDKDEFIFEYTPDKSQNLIISVKVNDSADVPADTQGCVSIIIGSVRL